MENITGTALLKERILYLEVQRGMQEQELKKELQAAHEFLKPGNLIKNGIKDLVSSPKLRATVIDAGLGLLTGTFSKKIIFGMAKGPLKGMLANLVQGVVAGKVAEHAGPLKERLINVVHEFLNKKEKTDDKP